MTRLLVLLTAIVGGALLPPGEGSSPAPPPSAVPPATSGSATDALPRQDTAAGTPITEAVSASSPAVRTHTACTDDPLCTEPAPPADPLAAFQGRYACRFSLAGRFTPCCPQYTQLLAQFWEGSELAIADYIIGRESGCVATIRNSSGCTGLWQMCGHSCPPNGCADAWSATVKAKQLYDQRRWCDWVLSGDPVTGRACG